jgi:hypothetical protein
MRTKTITEAISDYSDTESYRLETTHSDYYVTRDGSVWRVAIYSHIVSEWETILFLSRDDAERYITDSEE